MEAYVSAVPAYEEMVRLNIQRRQQVTGNRRIVGENKMNRFHETALQLCIILTDKVDGEYSTRNWGICEKTKVGKWISSSGNGGITDTNIVH